MILGVATLLSEENRARYQDTPHDVQVMTGEAGQAVRGVTPLLGSGLILYGTGTRDPENPCTTARLSRTISTQVRRILQHFAWYAIMAYSAH
jgi:hypothetical protein